MSSAKGVAVVTGAAQGIGKAIALRLADDGFDVAVNDLPLPEKIAKLKEVEHEIIRKGRRSAIFPGDVSSDIDVKGMVEGTVNTLGGLDVVRRVIFISNDVSSRRLVRWLRMLPSAVMRTYLIVCMIPLY